MAGYLAGLLVGWSVVLSACWFVGLLFHVLHHHHHHHCRRCHRHNSLGGCISELNLCVPHACKRSLPSPACYSSLVVQPEPYNIKDINHKTVSRLLACWLFVNQQLVIIVGFCTKSNHYNHCCSDRYCDQQHNNDINTNSNNIKQNSKYQQ